MSSRGRLGWIAILVVTLLAAALQAKLGLYHCETSQASLVSKAFKPCECRLDRFVPNPPGAALHVAISTDIQYDRRPEPSFGVHAPVRPKLLAPREHWFRPPPSFS